METIISYVICVIIGLVLGGILAYRNKETAQAISSEASKIKEKFKE